MKTAILAGATGLTGSHLMNLILENSDYDKLIILVRHDTRVSHPKLIQQIIDFDAPQSYSDLIKGDDFFCCLGTTIKKAGSQEAFAKIDLDYPVRLAQIAEKNGVRQFLMISSIGANARSTNFYLRTKGKCEEAISKITFQSVSFFRPSFLTGERKEFRLGEKAGAAFMRLFSFLLIGKLKKYRSVEARQVAKAMYTIAQKNTKGVRIYESDKIQEL